jgi:hypothetical protein
MTKDAQMLVRSVLGEAYLGPVAGVLRKYHLTDQAGNLRITTAGADPEKGKKGEIGPIVDPEVIEKFLALDPSGKGTFEWMIFASGGGEPHIRESERAMELGKSWVIENRMKGEVHNGDGSVTKIKPMTREEAEQSWQTEVYPEFHIEYFYASQDLAADLQYPVFGWFQHWPGRNSVYQKIVDAVTKWKALAKDKSFVRQWNKSNPKEPFRLNLMEAGKPVFKDVDALAEYVGTVRAVLARRKAEQNVVTVGKNPEGGYRTGADEVLYEDDILKVIVPLTAAASLKKGFNDWCVANRSRWETYFKTRRKEDLMWGTYTQRGPFAFLHLKVPTYNDPHLQSIAAHVQLSQGVNSPNRIDWWDRQNQAAIRYPDMARRMERAAPNAGKRSLDNAVREIEAWLKEFKAEQLERFPATEMLAIQLVASLID